MLLILAVSFGGIAFGIIGAVKAVPHGVVALPDQPPPGEALSEAQGV